MSSKPTTTIRADISDEPIPDLRPSYTKNPPKSPDNKSNGFHALIFGASGITGWALMNQAVTYPTPTTFSRIIGLSNRPLAAADAQLPADARIELYSGIDLSKGKVEAVEQLRKVKDIEKTTHVYFAAYTGHGNDFRELKRANVEILGNAVDALELVCPDMQFFTLQTGGKAYGIEFTNHVKIPTPTPESTPRIPEPWASNIFYYDQYDLLVEKSANATWKFCEIRPDVIVGFVPQNNAMNAAQAIALFLTLYRIEVGQGAEVPFPGDETAWTSTRMDTSQDVLARFHIFASMHPDKVIWRAFNIANGDVVSWAKVWPGICEYFGLKGVGPRDHFSATKWILDRKDTWAEWEGKSGLKKGALEGTTWSFMDGVMGAAKVNREYDLSASREVGFTETMDTVKSFHVAFDRLKAAKIIP